MVSRVSPRVVTMKYTYTISKPYHTVSSLYDSDLSIQENETGRWIFLNTLKEDASLIEDKESSVYRIYQYVLKNHPELLL